MRLLKRFWHDQAGLVLSAELVLVLTIAVLAVIVGIHSLAAAVTNELNDVSNAIGALDQSYSYNGLFSPGHAAVVGSGYIDRGDYCDCTVIGPLLPGVKSSGGAAEAAGTGRAVSGSGRVVGPTVTNPCPPSNPCPPGTVIKGKIKPMPDKSVPHGKPRLVVPHKSHK